MEVLGRFRDDVRTFLGLPGLSAASRNNFAYFFLYCYKNGMALALNALFYRILLSANVIFRFYFPLVLFTNIDRGASVGFLSQNEN